MQNEITLEQAKALYSKDWGKCTYIGLPYPKVSCQYCEAKTICPQVTDNTVDWELIEKMVKSS